MHRLLALVLIGTQLACCTLQTPECRDARTFISRLERRIIELTDRPVESGVDIYVDRVLIQELREQRVDLEAQVRAYCS
jgi:hypothetical protein